jgi:hypothetical protein
MNAEDFIMYAILFIIAAAGGAYLLFDAWRDRREQAARDAERCCPAGFGCNKCYYGLPK